MKPYRDRCCEADWSGMCDRVLSVLAVPQQPVRWTGPEVKAVRRAFACERLLYGHLFGDDPPDCETARRLARDYMRELLSPEELADGTATKGAP